VTGYFQTPLFKKLGIKTGFKICLINPPENYLTLLAPLPDRVVMTDQLGANIDLIHVFTREATELKNELPKYLNRIKQNGIIWVSWPKKSSKVNSNISQDVIREIALPLGLVDIKVCAVDKIWSGLKLVIRKTNRQ
jgi:hypothetical protein